MVWSGIAQGTYVASSLSSLGWDADDSWSNDSIDIIALLVGDDGHADEVQELKKTKLDTCESFFWNGKPFPCNGLLLCCVNFRFRLD